MSVATLPRSEVVEDKTDEPIFGGHFVHEDVPWSFYTQTLCVLQSAGQHAKVTYDEGRMEIMTVSRRHEIIKTGIGRLLEAYSIERRIPIEGVGGVTCRREDLRKGLEPDECYYIKSQYKDTGGDDLDLNSNPPPDLAIEVEVSRTVLSRIPIYAALGVPELWRFDGDIISVMHLAGKEYQPTTASRFLPELDLTIFAQFARKAVSNQFHAVLEFVDHLRAQKPEVGQ